MAGADEPRRSAGDTSSDSPIDAELEFHRTETIEALVARGWTEVDARAEADRRFGDRHRYRRELERLAATHAMSDREWGHSLARRGAATLAMLLSAGVDSGRATARLLRKSPGFAATALVTLALGTGANTAVFSVVDAVLLRPLPYAAADRLVVVADSRGERRAESVDAGNLQDYRTAASLEGIATFNRASFSLTKSGSPEQLLSEKVSWNLFDVLGVRPAIGRAFTPDEDRPGGNHVVILTHAVWANRFAGDPEVLGRTILLNDDPYVVVGVMPDGFTPLSGARSGFTINIFVPAALTPELLANRRDLTLDAVARLAPNASIDQARAELRQMSADLAHRFPDTNHDVVATLTPLRDALARDARLSLLVLLGAVVLVLLIACINLANLLFVRAIGQRREIAIRMALGASRSRVALDFALRGVWLGLIGGSAGLVLGIWLRDWLVALAPSSIPLLQPVALNVRVFTATAAAAVFTGGVAGLLPALQMWHQDAAPTLKASALSTGGARAVARWRGVLTAAEIAAALMLTICAGLLVRSLVRLTDVDLGFRTDKVVMFAVRLPPTRYRDSSAHVAFFADLERLVRALPGVEVATFADIFPMRGGDRTRVAVDGHAASVVADFQAVSPGYFDTLGIPIARGRSFNAGDRPGAPDAAVVSAAFVTRVFGDRDPIGLRFRTGESPRELSVVGVTGDVRREGQEDAIRPQVYVAAAQTDAYTAPVEEFAVRTTSDPYALLPAIQRAVSTVDPDQPITHVQTFDEMVSRRAAPRRFNMLLLGGLAALAVGLALVGLYGVVAHAAAQRSREIGIRVALGAQRRDVIQLAAGAGVTWALAGIAVGLGGAYLATRVMTSLLFDVAATDAVTFAAATILTLVVVCLASYLPARRAAAANPVATLRQE